MRFIQYGDVDVMIAGGTESATTILGVGGFCALKALTKNNDNPEAISLNKGKPEAISLMTSPFCQVFPSIY